ncbi:MAG TPA: methyltransferase domain-containing protein [Conexibacter sp.]|nr:methyltransferase domain-containing protein [Conexibacter sp.]
MKSIGESRGKLLRDGDVGDGIAVEGGRWAFSGPAAEHFDTHVQRSVPGYEDGHQLVLELSDFFMATGTRVVDVGCSTGPLIEALAKRHPLVDAELVGVDSSPEMVAKARERCAGEARVRIEHCDARKVDYTDATFVVLYYTLQFIPIWQRREVLERIHGGLRPGGAMVVFEKTRWSSGKMQDFGNQVYTSFKLRQGFGPDEILSKSQSLRGVLDPLSSEDNAAMIRNLGFDGPHSIYRFLAFEGSVAFRCEQPES